MLTFTPWHCRISRRPVCPSRALSLPRLHSDFVNYFFCLGSTPPCPLIFPPMPVSSPLRRFLVAMNYCFGALFE